MTLEEQIGNIIKDKFGGATNSMGEIFELINTKKVDILVAELTALVEKEKGEAIQSAIEWVENLPGKE